jgi:hypothetical protein
MASYIAAANAGFITGSTWHAVSAASLLDSETNNVVVATAASWTTSAAFVPGAVEVDGVAVKLYARTGTTGTFKIELYNSTDATTEGTCTVNVADICSVTTPGTTNEGGWMFFSFAAHTLDAADNHVVRCQTSSASQVTLYRDATAGNISRMVRTTTDAASPPAAASILHIMEEKTGAGTATARTVTMDNILDTDYGSGTDGTAALTISDGGTLIYTTDGANTYTMRLSGNCIVYNLGTLNIGTTGTPIPRGSGRYARMRFDPAADGGMGLLVRNGGTCTMQALSRTSGKNIYYCKLNTDEAAAQTTLGVDTDTGWLTGDNVVIASTTRTASQTEKRILNADAGASSIVVTSGLTNAHSGTSPTQAEVIHYTRSIYIESLNSATMWYFYVGPTATVDIDWAEFYYLGENAAGKRGIEVATTTGSFNMQYSSIHDTEDWGMYLISASGSNIVISNNVFYNLNTAAALNSASVYITATSGTTTFTNNICLLLYCYSYGAINLADNGVTFTGNTVVGGSANYGAVVLVETSVYTIGTFNNNTLHSGAGYGLQIAAAIIKSLAGVALIEDCNIWRNTSAGLYLNGSHSGLTFDTIKMWGNGTNSILCNVFCSRLIFESCEMNADTTFSANYGLNCGGIGLDAVFYNCKFGTASGILTTHSTADIFTGNTVYSGITNIRLYNCMLSSATEVSGVNNGRGWDVVRSSKNDQTAGKHKSWFVFGSIESDTSVFNTASPSVKMTPNTATYKLESNSFKVNVNSGQTCTPSVYTRKSEAAEGDSANYNGNHQRLIVKRNDAIGITVDAVLDTATGAIGNPWEQLTGTTAAATDDGVMEFVVDCDGTTGFVNIDDFSATVA